MDTLPLQIVCIEAASTLKSRDQTRSQKCCGMKFFCTCVLVLAALCCSGPVKRFNTDLSYRHAGKRQQTAVPADVGSSAASGSAAGVASAPSNKVVSNLFISNKLSAKDSHAIQLAHWCEGNEHVPWISDFAVILYFVF